MTSFLEDVTLQAWGGHHELPQEFGEASVVGSRFAGDLTRAFEDAALKGRTLSEVLKQLAFSLSRQTLEAALSPITSLFGSGLTGLLGGLGSVASPIARHAQGGVIASPIAFPLSGRRLGLAGEAGPEAILPLTRGHDGRLGVRAQGAANALNITFNVMAQDAQSFRRSEGQIAAMLSRAVGRGQRNL